MSLRDRLIQLVIDGCEPIPSGNGEHLYWKKDGKYCKDLPYPLHSKAAVVIVADNQFWFEVEHRRAVE